MSSSSLDYLELCRLCLVKDRVQAPIFEEDGDVNQIFLKIHACLPVKVSRDDKLPKKICDDCLYNVNAFYQFWNTTANAEKQLLQWLGEVEGLEDKQGYVTEVLDSNVMKQEHGSDNRLDGSVMQVSGHQNMDINMIENMSIITMPAGSEHQFTTVPIDTGGTVQTVQVSGPSTQTAHDQTGVTHLQEVEVDDDEDNMDDGCDNDDGLPVKEETDEGERSLEQTYVSLPCDEAGPSGLQQQKISEMSEITIQQTADGDPKTGSSEEPTSTTSHTAPSSKSSGRGIFVIERESLVMRKWQILEFNGKPYYAFVPEDDMPIKEEEIPEYPDSTSVIIEDDEEVPEEENNSKESILVEPEDEDEGSMDVEWLEETPPPVVADVKPTVANGKVQTIVEPASADLYQVKMEGNVVLLEKLNVEPVETSQESTIAYEETNDASQEIFTVNDVDDDEDEDDETFVETTTSESSKKALKCKACSETFETSLAFRKHVAWTHKKKICIQEGGSYVCSVCDYRTQKKNQFATHLQRKHETWTRRRQSTTANFPCQVCNFVCRSKHSLQSHFVRKHTDKYEHQCSQCDKKFKVKGDLTNHVRFHHREKPVNCGICGKQCLNSGSLYVHQKWAHYKPKFECAICKRRMVTQENLDQHMVMQHERREKIVCAECGKTFTKKDSFKRHMAVHTGAKPYSCVICNKPFARRSQLRQHLLIHTGKRPFVCDICGKAFTQKPGLICHRKTHPGKHPPLPVMPIGDIVKEFTESYLAEHAPGKKQEGLDDDGDEPETEEDEEEYYEEEEGILEEELLEADLELQEEEVLGE